MGKGVSAAGKALLEVACKDVKDRFPPILQDVQDIFDQRETAKNMFCVQLKVEQLKGGDLTCMAGRVSQVCASFLEGFRASAQEFNSFLDIQGNIARVAEHIFTYGLVSDGWNTAYFGIQDACTEYVNALAAEGSLYSSPALTM